ncbi:nuclear pore complex protein Nup50 [Anopheles nili]|uniref:nuclear pore complex protein Nup50 n=1 Tax=Anopheles nili TaxID=185578 RepID=UPI00237A12E6|nr:nuclear pore complex protein Nup50 [Anopheles nili]
MSKRGPQSTLNHLNWNETEEPEEIGEFAKASDEVLKQRVIKKARRATPSTAAAPSVFGAFKGFSSTPITKGADDKPAGIKTFSFLANLGAAKTNDNGTATVSSSGSTSGDSKPMFSFGSNAGAAATSDSSKKVFTFGSPSSLKADSTDGAKSPTSSLGVSSSKESDADSSNNLFSFATSTAKSSGSTSFGGFGSGAPKLDSAVPDKKFTFGSPAAAKDTTPATTFPMATFGSIAAKSDTKEPDTNASTIGSPTAAKDTTKGMFSFGSNAAKSDATELGKKTFTFGSLPSPASKDATTEAPKSTFTFGSSAVKSDSSDTIQKSTSYFGSPSTGKDTAITSPKAMFSFGSNAPKVDTSDTEKKTFTFGSFAASKENATSPKATFSFGSSQPIKSSASDAGSKTFGSPPAKLNATDTEKKTFSFGVPASSKENAGALDKPAVILASPKVSSDDAIKKMFNFAPSVPAKDDAAKKTVSFAPLPAPKPATGAAKTSGTVTDKDKSFQRSVVTLNKSFVSWITKKVQENPFCKLHVVFRDYEKLFAKMEAEKLNPTKANSLEKVSTNKGSEPAKEQNKQLTTSGKEAKKADDEKQSFGSVAKESPPKPVASIGAGFTFGAAKPFSFGNPIGGSTTSPQNSKTTTNNTGDVFSGSSSTVATSSPSFFSGATMFGSKPVGTTTPLGGGFMFGNVVKPPAPDSSVAGDKPTGDADADEDEPPKVEFTPVEEKDSLFSKRCKLFVKVDGSYSDRGVGTVHIKQVDSKVQVLVRADTNLGNILLNIILNESVPLQRMGKNNVMMICLPTPDSKPPPTSVLLRVKTAEEADELHETLLKYKPK